MVKTRSFLDRSRESPNHRVIVCIPSELPTALQSMNLASVMVLGVVAINGRMMSPNFIPAGPKMNTAKYMQILKEISILPINSINFGVVRCKTCDVQPGMSTGPLFQGIARRLQKILMFMSNDILPSSSLDLNPCDFWLWSVVEKKTNDPLLNDIGSLKMTIQKPFKRIHPGEVRMAYRAFHGRVWQVLCGCRGLYLVNCDVKYMGMYV